MVEPSVEKVKSSLSLESQSDGSKGDYGSPFYAKKALTGFVIDSFDKIIIYIEGQMNGALQMVWNTVMTLPSSEGRLLYNSDLIFQNRLYPEFIPYGGFHIITMRAPLDMYLTNPRTFVEGYIPASCWKALLNLDLLLKCTSMRSPCRNRLFPTTESLLNFDMEFGVPLYNADTAKEDKADEKPIEEENVETEIDDIIDTIGNLDNLSYEIPEIS